jgi:hypothetical protein
VEDNDDGLTYEIDPTEWPPRPPLLVSGEADEQAIRRWVGRWVFGEAASSDVSRVQRH